MYLVLPQSKEKHEVMCDASCSRGNKFQDRTNTSAERTDIYLSRGGRMLRAFSIKSLGRCCGQCRQNRGEKAHFGLVTQVVVEDPQVSRWI